MVKNNIDMYNSSIEEENNLLKSIEELRVKIIECKNKIKTAKLVEKISLVIAGLSTLSSVGIVLGSYSFNYLFITFTLLCISMNCASSARAVVKGEEIKIQRDEQKIEESSSKVEEIKNILSISKDYSEQLLSGFGMSLEHSECKTASKGKTKVRNIIDENK